MSTKEEAELVKRCKAGDKEARDRLIEHNLRLVAHIVKKYSANGDNDDLISIGTIGLIKAIDTFDEGKGIRLATYASRCIDNELLMMLRSGRKQAREVYLYESIGSDKEGNEISLLDIIEAPDVDIISDLELKENVIRLYQMMDTLLNEREREIIRMRYGLKGREVTQRELAKQMGISRSYVSRIEKKALAKLRNELERI